MSRPARVFLSYARENQDFALRLAKDIRSAGWDVWMDQLDIGAGVRWDHAIQEALSSCESLVVVLSPAAVASENVSDEVGYALDEGKKVIPVLLEPCDVPLRLRRVQRVEVGGDYEDALSTLLHSDTGLGSPPEDSGRRGPWAPRRKTLRQITSAAPLVAVLWLALPLLSAVVLRSVRTQAVDVSFELASSKVGFRLGEAAKLLTGVLPVDSIGVSRFDVRFAGPPDLRMASPHPPFKLTVTPDDERSTIALDLETLPVGALVEVEARPGMPGTYRLVLSAATPDPDSPQPRESSGRPSVSARLSTSGSVRRLGPGATALDRAGAQDVELSTSGRATLELTPPLPRLTFRPDLRVDSLDLFTESRERAGAGEATRLVPLSGVRGGRVEFTRLNLPPLEVGTNEWLVFALEAAGPSRQDAPVGSEATAGKRDGSRRGLLRHIEARGDSIVLGFEGRVHRLETGLPGARTSRMPTLLDRLVRVQPLVSGLGLVAYISLGGIIIRRRRSR